MKKEEILRISRNEHNDEGAQYVHNQGRMLGTMGMMIVFAILSIYYLYIGQHENIYSLLSIIFAYLCFESYGIFKYTRSKGKIFSIVIGAFLCLIFLIMAL